jgi:hypothetical protein
LEGKVMELWFTDMVFRYSKERELKHISISDDDISKIGKLIENLSKVIRRDYWEDDFLRDLYLLIRNYYLNFSTSLIPFDRMTNVDLHELRLKFRELKAAYPNLYDGFLEVAQLFKKLLDREENLLMNEVITLSEEYLNYKIAIVTRRSLKEEEFTIFLSSLDNSANNMKFFNEGSFKKSREIFDLVLFIGSEQYFQPFANNVPLSKKTYFVSYSIFKNYFQIRNLFTDIDGSFSNVYDGIVNKLVTIQTSIELISIEEEKIDSHTIQQYLSRYDEDNNYSNEPVEAKIINLESDNIVLLQKNTKYKTVDPSSEKKIILKSLNQIELDDYLLIFSVRESSIIAKIADELVFKEKAVSYRNIQKHWKNRLEKLIEKVGVVTASSVLQEAGAKTAKPYNLKNWLKEGTISPRDLPLILPALKYNPEETLKILKVTEKIFSAHIKAGNIISRKAEEVISSSDLKKLITNGKQTFELPEFPGATFMIDRIVGIGKDTIKVNQNRIMQLYEWNELN